MKLKSRQVGFYPKPIKFMRLQKNRYRISGQQWKGIKLYAAADKGGLPRLFTPAKNKKGESYTIQIVGRPENEKELFHLFETDLHMNPGAQAKPTEATVSRERDE